MGTSAPPSPLSITSSRERLCPDQSWAPTSKTKANISSAPLQAGQASLTITATESKCHSFTFQSLSRTSIRSPILPLPDLGTFFFFQENKGYLSVIPVTSTIEWRWWEGFTFWVRGKGTMRDVATPSERQAMQTSIVCGQNFPFNIL